MHALKTLVIACTLLCHSSAVAVIFSPPGDAKSFVFGPFSVTPLLAVELAYDDNIFSSASEEQAAWIARIKPKLVFAAVKGINTILLQYAAEKGQYEDNVSNSYFDQEIAISATLEPDNRVQVAVEASYLKSHEELGSGFTEGLESELDEGADLTIVSEKLKFRYGAEGAKGRVEVAIGHVARRNDSFSDTSFLTDRDDLTVESTLYLRFTPKTYCLLEAEKIYVDYSSELALLDSEESNFFIGMTWQGTAKLDGTIKLGILQKQFDESAIDDFESTAWQVNANWRPKKHMQFSFETYATALETNRQESTLIEYQRLSLAWRHSWSSRFSTYLNFTAENKDYLGFTREDDVLALQLKLNYRFRPWLGVSLEYALTHQDSSFSAFDYKRNKIMLNVNASL